MTKLVTSQLYCDNKRIVRIAANISNVVKDVNSLLARAYAGHHSNPLNRGPDYPAILIAT